MTPGSGWYPDPTGAAEYRFWDGQNWTTATTSPSQPLAAPATPAGGTQAGGTPAGLMQTGFVPTPSGSSQGYGPQAYAVTLPGAFGTPTGQYGKPRRSTSSHGLVAGLAAAAVVAAAALSFVLTRGNDANSKPGALHPPASVNGAMRLQTKQTTSLEKMLRDLAPAPVKYTVAAYGSDLQNVQAIVVAATTNVGPGGQASGLKGMEDGVRRTQPNVVFTDEDPGVYGGQLRCASSVKSYGAVCLFVDNYGFGIVGVAGPSATALTQAINLRFRIETPPTT